MASAELWLRRSEVHPTLCDEAAKDGAPGLVAGSCR